MKKSYDYADVVDENAIIVAALTDLRHFVDNLNKAPGIALRGKTYRTLDDNTVHTITCDGIEYGYKLYDRGVIMERRVFLLNKNGNFLEMDPEEREQMVINLFEAFFDYGSSPPDIVKADREVMVFSQRFQPAFLVETKPNIVRL